MYLACAIRTYVPICRGRNGHPQSAPRDAEPTPVPTTRERGRPAHPPPRPLLPSAPRWPTSSPCARSTTTRRSSGPLADVVAPPYDVIDAAQRAELIARSPFNVVAVDLPSEGRGGRDRYAAAGELFESWQLQGALVRDSEPALWAHTQDYTGPDGVARTRSGFFCRVRIEEYGPGRVRPHERTHPGPEGGSPAPDAGDAREHVADLLAVLGPGQRGLAGPRAGDRARRRGAMSPTPTALSTGSGASPTPRRSPLCRPPRGDAELLIADGHHRYETMQHLRRGARRRGRAPLHPHVPCRAGGPGADGLPHAPADRRPRRRAPRRRSRRRSSATSTSPRCRSSRSRRPTAKARSSSATSTVATAARCD